MARSDQTLTVPPSRRYWIKWTLPISSRTSASPIVRPFSSLADFNSITPGRPCDQSAEVTASRQANSHRARSRQFDPLTLLLIAALRYCAICFSPLPSPPVVSPVTRKIL